MLFNKSGNWNCDMESLDASLTEGIFHGSDSRVLYDDKCLTKFAKWQFSRGFLLLISVGNSEFIAAQLMSVYDIIFLEEHLCMKVTGCVANKT